MATGNLTTFTDLPLELLWMVSEYLSPADIACLALCNHHLLFSFAGTDFHSFFSNGRTGNPSDNARIDLLSRLSRDLPQYHLCFICLRLRSWEKTEPPKAELPDNSFFKHCSKPLGDEDLYLRRPLFLSHFPSYTYYEFCFIHLQLVMRRFYHGPGFGIPVDSLLYTEIGPKYLTSTFSPFKENDQDHAMMTLFSAEGRICSMPPSLCLRTQELVVVARQNVSQIWPFPQRGFMKVCRHIYNHGPRFPNTFEPQIEGCCSETKEQADYGRCKKCNTSWKLEIRTVNEESACLVFTRWMDLGPGLSPDDARWRHHLTRESLEGLAEHELVDSRLRFERDSIQASLPNARSEDEMYHRNLSLLQGHPHKMMIPLPYHGVHMLRGELKPRPSCCIIL